MLICTQDPVPFDQLDTDAILMEGPIEIVTDCVSPMAVELCAYRSAPDWQRNWAQPGGNHWFPLVGGVVSVSYPHMHATVAHARH